MRPLIGVFTSDRRTAELGTLRGCAAGGPAPQLRLGVTYLRAIEAAGGLPVVLAPDDLELAAATMARLDGLCLAGGPDLDPAGYGAAGRHALLQQTDPVVDAGELALARTAERLGLPVLGICRGAQALNVLRGGTLHQHVGGHVQDDPAPDPAHVVAVAPGSLLAALTGAERLAVNSFHHQAVDRLGAGLVIAATAPDGTVEAIEDPSSAFLVGVQWHAEAMAGRPEQLALFAGLVAAAAAPRLALAA